MKIREFVAWAWIAIAIVGSVFLLVAAIAYAAYLAILVAVATYRFVTDDYYSEIAIMRDEDDEDFDTCDLDDEDDDEEWSDEDDQRHRDFMDTTRGREENDGE